MELDRERSERDEQGVDDPACSRIRRGFGVGNHEEREDQQRTAFDLVIADVRLPGMVHARILRGPKFGSKLVSMDDSKVKAIPGVIAVGATDPDFGPAFVFRGYSYPNQKAFIDSGRRCSTRHVDESEERAVDGDVDVAHEMLRPRHAGERAPRPRARSRVRFARRGAGRRTG